MSSAYHAPVHQWHVHCLDGSIHEIHTHILRVHSTGIIEFSTWNDVSVAVFSPNHYTRIELMDGKVDLGRQVSSLTAP